MHRALIEQRIRHFYERRAADDPEGMYLHAAPDVVYRLGSYRNYPFQAERRGKSACIEMSRVINVHYENLGSEFHEMVIDSDLAAFRRTTRLRNRGSGETISIDVINFFRFRDGLLAEIVEFPDTEAVAQLDLMNRP